MTNPRTLDDMLAFGEAVIARALTHRADPARYITFCTISANGPEARTVMLRRWADGVAVVQTDAASAKIAELETDNRAALLLWSAADDLQIRLRTRVTVQVGDAASWAKMPAPARLNYGGTPAPATPMTSAESYVPGTDPNRLAILRCAAYEMEILHLGAHMHRRTLFMRAEGGAWAGHWIAP